MLDLIKVAEETLKIIDDKQYTVKGNVVKFPTDKNVDEVVVCSPKQGNEYLKEDISSFMGEKMCDFRVACEDSFQAASAYKYPLVMNFASARHPGGGFTTGARAQEEALCRSSTLYASLITDKAAEMYLYNEENKISVYSDYMLFSPNVLVFRDANLDLLSQPFMTAVATVPAPNRSAWARNESDETIEKVMTHRIRVMLRWAIKNGNRSLVLGAWGCGVFRNKPEDVAWYFKKVLVDEGYGKCFDEVCFAVYGREDSPNLKAFVNIF